MTPARLPTRPGRAWHRLPVSLSEHPPPRAAWQTLSAEELEKAKVRAERFGVPVRAEQKAAQSAEQDAKKQKRAERFGTGEAAKAPLDPEEAERLAKRAARFAPSQPAAA